MPCDACGRSATSRWCLACAATAVGTSDRARSAARSVARWAERLGMVFEPNFVLRVVLIDRPERPGHLGSTLVRRSVDGRRRHSRILGIRIVRDLPDMVFRGVVAHELAHVWAALRGWRMYSWAEEGFGELMAYRLYRDVGTPQALFLARRIATNPDPLYGGGFRRMLQLLRGADPANLRRLITRR